ncbi:CDP-alcohol phosphatidyltransferase family protein [Leptospira sp. GIMC2001]|uniref:CDP-alcohol phosphatidyltransferase family protein n=1 Tax=Leptospira sp. GIMC2001 TaxID=1513297 RepID=UPI00234B3088|nr:CDP-alcohol phosphatidyltransferase family protein [Leptospira sp. GIMC2001]WCL47540.1 CDP-alcohol phosphatidyltransferase family protein [Leptospira sp. GIMC2001]
MHWKQIFWLPNILTLSRVIFALPAILLFHSGNLLLSYILFGFIFLTDFLDGMFARRMGLVSELGSILDPVCDKILVLSLFTYFYAIDLVPIWYYGLILLRDISQLTSVPVLLFWKKIQFKVKPKLIPKWGTALNFILLAILPSQYFLPYFLYEILVLDGILYPLLFISASIEIYILVTFLPRFYQIYIGSHDTFE